MKLLFLMVGIWMLLAGAARAEEGGAGGYRIFTSKDGRSIEGRIVEYDARKGKFELERRGAGTVWVTPDIFGEEDQTYIKEWIAGSIFLNKSMVRGTVKEVTEGKDIYYELILRNQSRASLEGLKVEYLIRVKIIGTGNLENYYRYEGGELDVGLLVAGQQTMVSTDAALMDNTYLLTKYVNSSGETESTSRSRLTDEKPSGVWFRVYGPEVEGRHLIRDFCEPAEFIEEGWISPERTLLVSISRTNKLVEEAWEEVRKKNTSNESNMLKLAYRNRRQVMELAENLQRGINESELKKIHEQLVPLYIMGVHDYKGVHSALIGRLMYDNGLIEEGLFWLEVSCEIGNNFAPYVRAEIFSSSPRDELHDGVKAVEVLESCEPRQFYHYAVRARAYARNKQFDRAVESQKKAIEVHQNYSCQCPEQVEALARQLEMYERGEPYTRANDEPPFWLDPCYLRHEP